MDTKLKKTALPGKLLVLGALLFLTALEMLLYPVYRSRVQSYGQPIYEREDFIYQVQRAAYGLYWMGVNEAENETYAPTELYWDISQQFLEGKEAETTEETDSKQESVSGDDTVHLAANYNIIGADVNADLNADLLAWANEMDYWLGGVSYQLIQNEKRAIFPGSAEMIDAGVLLQNEDIDALLKNENKQALADYQYIVQVVFNAEGILSEAKSVYNANQDSEAADALWTQVIQAAMEKAQQPNAVGGPRDVTFYYALQRPELINAFSSSYYSRFYFNESRGNMSLSGDLLAYYFGILAAAAMGLVLAIKRPSRGFLHQLPLEVALPALCGCLLAVPLAHEMVTMTLFTGVERRLAQTLHLQLITTTTIIWLLNAAAWLLLFSLTFWSVRALSQICRAGIKQYLSCRCLMVRFCRWVWRILVKAWRRLVSLDFTDRGKRKLLLLAAVNFLVCCLLVVLGMPWMLLYQALLVWLLMRQYRKYQKNYGAVQKAVKEMAEGELSGEIEEDVGPFEPLKDQLSAVRTGFQRAVEEEVKSQNMKTELISNVSHDLKTPLTAIITYVDLLKDETLSEQTRREYIATLDKKSQRLKRLIEDLFEASKAASGNVTMQMETVDLCALLKQVQHELSDQLEAGGIEYRWDIPDDRILLELDGQKTCRIFENLLINISKYGMPGTRAYISAQKRDGWAVVTMKNISASELDFDPSEITERFVRGDKARHTEGSGLGLAIVRSFTELQNGRFTVGADADLFKAEVCFPLHENAGANL